MQMSICTCLRSVTRCQWPCSPCRVTFSNLVIFFSSFDSSFWFFVHNVYRDDRTSFAVAEPRLSAVTCLSSKRLRRRLRLGMFFFFRGDPLTAPLIIAFEISWPFQTSTRVAPPFRNVPLSCHSTTVVPVSTLVGD